MKGTTGLIEERAVAAYLAGRYDEGAQLWVRAFQERVTAGDVEAAAACAHWVGFVAVIRGEYAKAAGWVARGLEVLGDRDCAERGYLTMERGMAMLLSGDVDRAVETISEAVAIAERYDDVDLTVLTRLGHAHASIAQGRVDEGLALMDSLMVPLMTGETSTAVAGLAYCAVIGTCFDRFDLQRARQWTAALTDFCDDRPDLVPYSGNCLVHRAELLQLRGEWSAAKDAAVAARLRFELGDDDRLAGMADYAAAELDRLRGDFDLAEEGYRAASRRGRDPQPGLALLRLAQGRVDDAAATVRRLVHDDADVARRPAVLAAHVTVMLRVGDVEAARESCSELESVSQDSGTAFVRAIAEFCHGALLLEDRKPGPALAALRRSVRDWLDLEAPYEVARARELAGLACRALGDEDSAALELEAARSTYRALGAGPDLDRLGDVRSTWPEAASRVLFAGASATTGRALTAREVEVLRLVATGATNRVIASTLVLSEKTVARHLSNVFTKIQVASRAAATAYAYDNGLVQPPAVNG